MKALLSKRLRQHFSNFLVSIILVFFSLISLVPPALAQNTVNPSQALGKQTVTTSTRVETGQTLGFFSCVSSLTDCISGSIGGVVSAIIELPQKFFEFIFSKLAEIVVNIVLFVAHIIHAVFGGATSEACSEGGSIDPNCKIAAAELAKIDPFFQQVDGPGITSRLNMFTVADHSYSTLYSNLPEISGPAEFLAVFKDNLLSADSAFAQGEGTDDLGGSIRNIWGKLRDLSYIGMAVVLIIIGFMVMMRRRLDPKTVVTATNSLPKVAIALILITFSFAISGFFIDLIYLSVGLTRNYFSDLPGLAGALSSLAGKFRGGEFLWLPFFTLISKSVISFNAFVVVISGLGIGAALSGGFGAVVAVIGIIAVLVFDIIIRLGLFILAVMLFWSLLIRYAQMVLLSVFSPFFFLAGAIPGFENVTTDWFKRMFAVVITFPAILVISYLALSLLSPTWPNITSTGNVLGSGSTGPLLLAQGAPPPVDTGGSILNIQALIGLGVLYFAHKVPGMIDKLFKIEGSKDRGPGPLIFAGAVGGGLKSAGNAGKTIGGIRDLVNQTTGIRGAVGRFGQQAGGYGRGETYFESPTGNFVTPTNSPVSGVRGAVSRFLSQGAIRQVSGRANPPESAPIVRSQAERNAEIYKELDRAIKAGEVPNPSNIRAEFGQVTSADFDNARRQANDAYFKRNATKPPTPKPVSPADQAEGTEFDEEERKKI